MKIMLGVVLMLAAIVLLLAMVVVPVIPATADNADVDTLLARVVCSPGETIIREQYTTRDSDGTGYSANLYCVDNENQRRDETARWIIISIIAFTVPLLASIFMFIWGAGQAARRMRTVVLNAGSSPIPGVSVTQFSTGTGSASPIEGLEIKEGSIKFGGMEVRMDGLTPERVQSLRQQVQTHTGADNLTNKLRQLQEARDAGLISTEEYDQLRKEILDNIN